MFEYVFCPRVMVEQIEIVAPPAVIMSLFTAPPTFNIIYNSVNERYNSGFWDNILLLLFFLEVSHDAFRLISRSFFYSLL